MDESKTYTTPRPTQIVSGKPVPLRGMKGRLVNSSIDGFVLALETINRISVRYRLEAFNYLIINAWELLLKAKIIHDSSNNEAIFRQRKRGEERRSHSLRHCLTLVFAEPSSVRLNIETVADERDKGTHLVLDIIPPNILAVYQACVVNYHRALGEWFGISLSDRVPVGMMTIVYDIDHRKIDLNNTVLRRRVGADTVKYLMRRQNEIEAIQESVENSRDYSAQIELSVSVTNNKRNSADLQLVGGASGDRIGVVNKYRDTSQTHTIYTVRAAEMIQERLALPKRVNDYDVRAICHHYQIKDRFEFYYHDGMKESRPRFTPAFVEWVVDEYRDNDQFISQARAGYREHQAQ